MADQNGGSNPVLGLGAMLLGSVTTIYGSIFLVGGVIASATGNVPIRGSLLNPWETGQYVGGLIHAGLNSGLQTFGDEKYFSNSKKIGSDAKPDQRLLSPTRPPSANVLPTRSNDANITGSTNPVITTPYEDTNGDGVISPEEIAKQNKR